MLNEHSKARELVHNMENSLHQNDNDKLETTIAQYAKLLKEHIYKEDNILYPMGERGLSDAAKSSLLTEYTETDKRLDSQTIWCKYLAQCTDLESQLIAYAYPTTIR
jgi:hemerythrin-like domain-containing protein